MKTQIGNVKDIFNRIQLRKVLTGMLVGAITITAVITYLAITNPDYLGFASNVSNFSTLLIMNLGLLLLLAIVVSSKMMVLLADRDRGRAGSKLLLKLVLMFSLVAIIPAIVVGFSSSFYLNLGIKSWFDERVSKAVMESVAVADAYLDEHKKVIRTDAVNMSNEVSNNLISFAFSNRNLERYLTNQSTRRLLSEAVVFQNNRILASSNLGFSIDPWQRYNDEDFRQADNGEVIIISENDDKVTALVSINHFDNTYLIISRYIDSRVMGHTKSARGAAEEYLKLKGQIADFQIRSTIFFVIIVGFVLLGALWMAFRFANNFVTPVSNLLAATDRIKKGEFTVRLKEGPANDEISNLIRSFNQMAAELESQKRGVIVANREAIERREFSDAVLAGISSGVIVINEDKKIALINSAAKEHAQLGDNSVNKYLRDTMPEFFDALQEAIDKGVWPYEKQITIRRKAKRMTFNIQIGRQTERNSLSYIITFDDITELLSAQRSAAWSDVARKIAHEIKNPLTPINLSAQRLAKKFKDEVPEDQKENFEGYTNTIIRHTADIARIIGEFSDFAKLPAPRFAKVNISTLLKDSVFSARVASSKIDLSLDMPDEMNTQADPGQITQVLTNILKNAAESVKESKVENAAIKAKATIGENIEIIIEDNGKGFPEELIDRITEPYVTTREKGTGLGLAIVKKIIEDHHGKLELSNTRNGAKVKIVLPVI